MNRAGDQLLAGPALALDENGRSAGRGLDDQVEHLTHARALADDVGELVVALLNVLPEVAVLVNQPTPLEGVADHHQHFIVLERLGDVVECSGFHRRNGALDGRVGRDDDDREVLVDRFSSSSVAMPSRPGIMMSTIAASTGSARASSRPSSPEDARRTLYPSRVSSVSRISRMISSSSMTRIVPFREVAIALP